MGLTEQELEASCNLPPSVCLCKAAHRNNPEPPSPSHCGDKQNCFDKDIPFFTVSTNMILVKIASGIT